MKVVRSTAVHWKDQYRGTGNYGPGGASVAVKGELSDYVTTFVHNSYTLSAAP